MWKTFKIVLIILLIFFVGLYLLMITPPGHLLLKKIVQSQLHRLTNLPVNIDRLGTNLFTYIQLKNVALGESENQKQPLLFFKNLKIQYNLWHLVNKKIILRDVQIDKLQITIEKDARGQYNFPENLFSTRKDTVQTTPKSRTRYKIQLHGVKIFDMDLSYSDQKNSINIILNQINMVMTSQMLGESFIGNLKIQNGSFNWRNLTQQLHKFETKFVLVNNIFDLTDFKVNTDALALEITGRYNLDKKYIQSGKILAILNFDILNHLEIFASDDFSEGKLEILGNVEGPVFEPDGFMKLKCDRGLIHNIPLNDFNAELTLKGQHLKLTSLSLETLTGHIQAEGNARIEKKDLQYGLNLSLNNFQLNPLFKALYHKESDHLEGILSGSLTIKGQGGAWKQLIARGKINLSQLSIFSQSFENIHTDFSFNNGKFDFNFKQNKSQMILTGLITSDSTVLGKFEGNLSTIEPIASLANVQGLKGRLQFTGNLNGNIKSPSINTNFRFWDGAYQGWPLTNVVGGITFENNQPIFSNLLASGYSPNLQNLARLLSLDSLNGVIDYNIFANGALDHLEAEVNLNWKNGQINRINFDELNIGLKTLGSDIFIERFDLQKKNTLFSVSGQLNYHHGILANLQVNLFENDSTKKVIRNRGILTIAGKLYHENLNIEVQGNEIEIHSILHLLNLDEYINGTLNFDSQIYGNLNQPDVNLTWNLSHLDYKNSSLDILRGKLYYKNNLLSVSEITAIKENGKFVVKGEFPFNLYDATPFSSPIPFIQLEADNFDLNILDAFMENSIRVDGKFMAQLYFQGNLQHPLLKGELKIDNGQLITPYFSTIDSIYLNTLFFDRKIQLKQLNGKMNKHHFMFEGEGYYSAKNQYDATLIGNVSQIGQIKITGTSQPDQNIFGQVRVDNLNLNNLVQNTSINTQLQGLVNVLVDVSGTQDSPFILLKVTSDQVGIEKTRLDSLRVHAFYDKNILNINESGFKINNGQIYFKGSIPVNFAQKVSPGSILNKIDLKSYANNLDIGWLRPFIPGIVNLQGKVHYDMKLAGSGKDPVINGFFNLQDGVVKIKDIIPEISAINAAINFDRNEIKIDKTIGKLETGSFNLNGKTRFSGRKFTDTKLALNLDKIKILSPKMFSINIEKGEIGLNQIRNRFRLQGNIQLSEARYIQDYKPQISKFLTQIPNRPQADKDELLNQVSLDIIIQGQENIWVENNLAKLQMTSNLNLFGTLAQPNISGRVVIIKGYVLYLDRKFKITNGLIDFTDPYRINPFIDITATCTVTDYQSAKEKKYTITLKLSGLLEKPEFMLVSEPQLDKTDMIAVLTVGRTRESLLPQLERTRGSSFQQIMIDRFKEITSQRIAGMTEQRLSRALALENISIEGNLFQLDKSWGPRVTATKQISDKINITYSTVVGHANEQQIKLGYQFLNNLSIIGSSSQRGESGLDLKFHIKFY